MKPSRVIFCLIVLILPSLHATSTMDCQWHAAYFDALFMGNYGSGACEKYADDVVNRALVVMQLDSIFKNLRREGKLKYFRRWVLVDVYMKCYKWEKGVGIVPRDSWIEGDSVYLCLTDSISINKVLKKLWHIEDVVVSPNRSAGMWLYSLHVGFSKTRLGARAFPHGGYVHERPDSSLLWLQSNSDPLAAHCWYQHEIDGYYHQYTGLYLTTKNVFEAQKLLLENRNLKTTITSHYVTQAIIRKYAYH